MRALTGPQVPPPLLSSHHEMSSILHHTPATMMLCLNKAAKQLSQPWLEPMSQNKTFLLPANHSSVLS